MCEAMFVEGVKEIRIGSEGGASFIQIVVASEADVRRLSGLWGKDMDGVPLRIVVD
jgi:hypothetical protein